MHPNQKIKFNDWYMTIDPPMWIAADFECMNVVINDNGNDSYREVVCKQTNCNRLQYS